MTIWEDYGIPAPPASFDVTFVQWLEVMSEQLDVCFIDTTPMTTEDMYRLQAQYGPFPNELHCFYQLSNPWGNYVQGVDLWTRVVSQTMSYCRERYVVHQQQDQRDQLVSVPPLWPVMLGNQHDIAAFTDQYGRLVLFKLIRQPTVTIVPRGIGLHNYFIAMVLLELFLDREEHQTLDQGLADMRIVARFRWPQKHPPSHPVLMLDDPHTA
ncbi:MAG: hypothetical protein AAGF95_28305 [Chloroflexota bacterium]